MSATARGGWKRPTRARVRAVGDRLREAYGRPALRPHHEPLEELVLTVLSQNTNDRNRDVAFGRLRARFPSWEAMAAAPPEELEEAIRPGGISRVKSERIQAILAAVAAREGGDGELELDWLRDRPLEEARDYLVSLPGVGRKTAACVLLFSFGQPDMPVDTHVYRVASRLGLIRPKASFDEAHRVLLAATDPQDVYELHMNLIRHGRRTCTARRPLCEQCVLRRMCPYGRELLRAARERPARG